MPKANDLPYFALEEPLSHLYVFALLGRVIPLGQLTKPLGGQIRPLLPPNNKLVTQREIFSGNPNSGAITEGSGVASQPDRLLPAPDSQSERASRDSLSRNGANNGNLEPPALSDNGSTITEVASNAGDYVAAQTGNSQKNDGDWVDLRNLTELYPPEAVECRNLRILSRLAANAKARIAVEDMLKMYASSGTDDQVSRTARGFRRIAIPTPQDKIKQLLQHKEYAEPVIQFLREQENKKAAVIVSILTCSEMTLQQSRGTSNGVGAGVSNPGLNEGATAPKIAAQAESNITTYNELSGTYVGEVIMACRYMELELLPPPPEEPGLLWRLGHRWRKWRGKLPKQNDKVQVSPVFLDPSHTLVLPLDPIKGTIPVILGDRPLSLSSLTSLQRRDSGVDMNPTAHKGDLDFTIFA